MKTARRSMKWKVNTTLLTHTLEHSSNSPDVTATTIALSFFQEMATHVFVCICFPSFSSEGCFLAHRP